MSDLLFEHDNLVQSYRRRKEMIRRCKKDDEEAAMRYAIYNDGLAFAYSQIFGQPIEKAELLTEKAKRCEKFKRNNNII